MLVNSSGSTRLTKGTHFSGHEMRRSNAASLPSMAIRIATMAPILIAGSPSNELTRPAKPRTPSSVILAGGAERGGPTG